MKSYLNLPVRGHDIKESEHVVKQLIEQGYSVYWPPRDTNQDDRTGLNICKQNRSGIENADVFHVIWDGKSQGCLFDAGMAFMARKPISIISVPDLLGSKSFQDMMTEWQEKSCK